MEAKKSDMLKARAYDILAQKEMLQVELTKLNRKIAIAVQEEQENED